MIYTKIDNTTIEKEETIKVKIDIDALRNRKQAIKRHIEAEQAEIAKINLELEEAKKLGITI